MCLEGVEGECVMRVISSTGEVPNGFSSSSSVGLDIISSPSSEVNNH